MHLVSHGNEQGLVLGNGSLQNNNLSDYSEAIAEWQNALNDRADLLIYGCDLAGGAEGQALLAGLQFLTDADIAASDDTTGLAALGGDWDLEYQTGSIETSIVFSTRIQHDWQGTLPTPSISNLAGDTLEYNEGDGAQTIEQGADVLTSLSGGGSPVYNTLAVSITTGGDASEDVLSILNQGSGAGQIGFDGINVSYEGTNFATVTGGSAGTDLLITFDSAASDNSVAALIENITYENTDNDNPTTTARNIDFTLTKTGGGGGGGDSTTNSTTINVSAVNNAPTAADNTVTTDEDTDYIFTAADFGFADVDGDSLTTVTITSLESDGSLKLNGVDVALNDVISKADIDAGKLSFIPASDGNGAAYDNFAFTVNDGVTDSTSSYTMTLDVTAVNDTPINIVPADQTTPEDSTLIFSTTNGNAISISDADASGDTFEVKLAVGKGTLSLSGLTGLSFSQGDGIGDRAMTFTGSIADINAALEGLAYTTDANANGQATLTIVTRDEGGTGPGSKSDTDDVTINVSEIDDVPTISGTPDTIVTIGGSYIFTPDTSDVDGDNLTYNITNKPDWAVFNSSTGELSGTPGDSDAGTILGITISVNDGSNTVTLATFDLTVNSSSGNVIEVTPPENIEPVLDGLDVTSEQAENESDDSEETTTADKQIKESVADIVLDVDASQKPHVLLPQGNEHLLQQLTPELTAGDESVNNIEIKQLNQDAQYNPLMAASPWIDTAEKDQFNLKLLLQELNQSLGKEALAEESINNSVVITTAAGLSIALSAGFISWALKGTSLMAALMATLPSWNNIDPLNIINAGKHNAQQNSKHDDHDAKVDAVFDNLTT